MTQPNPTDSGDVKQGDDSPPPDTGSNTDNE